MGKMWPCLQFQVIWFYIYVKNIKPLQNSIKFLYSNNHKIVQKQEDNLIYSSVKNKGFEINLNKEVKAIQWSLSNTEEKSGRRQTSVNQFLINLYL